MTNFEKWNKEIGELKGSLAVVNGVPCCCDSITCNDCEFDDNDCVLDAWDWLWKKCEEVDYD